nr:MAG TPA: hypothetical protein [Bacteriophage sp.]DAN22394.1 MAG TPA_asm: hypothetical protein [Bacteriophage sp.]
MFYFRFLFRLIAFIIRIRRYFLSFNRLFT